jgi:hypothetical protein
MGQAAWRAWALVLCAGAASAGCGGGAGSGESGAPDLFAGTYERVSWEGVPDQGHAASVWGVLEVNGAGLVTGGTAARNENGFLYPAVSSPPIAYLVDTDRTLSLYGAATRVGALSADGAIAAFAGSSGPVDAQVLVVLVRHGIGLSDATFQGTYHAFSLLSFNSMPPWYEAGLTLATADGAGLLGSGGGSSNFDGIIVTTGSVGSTYHVAPDGTLDIDAGAFVGGITPTGDFAVVAGGTAPASRPQLRVFVR